MVRHKRDVDENDAIAYENNDEVFLNEMPSSMHYLLRLSRAIDGVRFTILNEPSQSHDRRKREAVDHISNVIQVCI